LKLQLISHIVRDETNSQPFILIGSHTWGRIRADLINDPSDVRCYSVSYTQDWIFIDI